MARRDPELRSSEGFSYILLMSAGLSWPLMATLCFTTAQYVERRAYS